MKKITFILCAIIMASLSSFAQNNVARDTSEIKPAKEIKNDKNVNEKVNVDRNDKTDKDKADQRLNAEENSKGHAFSGKGKGGDKNIVDPVKKDKKVKKNKKDKKKAEIKNPEKVPVDANQRK